jgi:hydrogenase maturation protein HypF
VKAPPAHGVGRLFDAVGALVLDRGVAGYEGQVAMALEWAADAEERGAYPFGLETAGAPWQVDLRPTVRAVVEDRLGGRAAGVIAARFHETLAGVAAALIGEAAGRHGRLPVVLGGGCFQNARLVGAMLRQLAAAGVEVYRPERVPPGDGGLALGQAVVADAVGR